MAQALYSPSWYRVAKLKPRLRAHARVHRHHYRGELWYVLQDRSTGKTLRFTPAAYVVLGLMDGRRTTEEVWRISSERLADEAPSQDEVIRLLGQLYAGNVLACDVPPDTDELLRRLGAQQHGRLKQNLRSPLSLRLPLLDPDRFLRLFGREARLAFGPLGAVAWLAVVGTALVLVGLHGAELVEDVTDRVLAPGNLVLLWACFPFVKAVHEFAHAFAVKARGGEVHEMGITLLVLTPVPYVDASAASAFAEKRDRVLVGLAGMLGELFLASLALFVWVNVEPGPVRAIAYDVVLVAGVSTLVFNANPLLRYDGYYVLADLLEIPNLAPRGTRFLAHLVERRAFGVQGLEEPVATPGERVWFVAYTIASFLYRLLVYASIVLFIASKFFKLGMLLAAWSLVGMAVLPAWKAADYLLRSPKLQGRRRRALGLTGLLAGSLAALVLWVPLPLRTRAEGVLWAPERSAIRAGSEGFVRRVLATPGARTTAGTPLVECTDPLLELQVKVLECRLAELRAVYDEEVLRDRVKAQITRRQLETAGAELARARERRAELTIRSPGGGLLALPSAADLPGKFLNQGETLGYVVGPGDVTARVVVPQADVDLVRNRTRSVEVRLAEARHRTLAAKLRREVPSATDQLPSTALGKEGGGRIPTDPSQGEGEKAFQTLFEFEVELALEGLPRLGERVYVRFDHGNEPLGLRWYRGLRGLLLRRLNV